MHVLLVEDDPLVAKLAGRLLESLGHTSVWEVSAELALERLEAEVFDLILSDHGLPSRSGTELLATVRERWPALPFVLVTGWATRSELADGSVVLPKPFTRNALEQALEQALAVN